MVVAARVLSTAEFGAYALAYTALWALNGLQSSLITQPHSVLASHTDVNAYRRYTSATGLMQLALCFALGIPFVIAGLIAIVTGAGPTLMALGFALIAWQAQEFLRRVLYFEGRLIAVVVLDVVSYGGQLAAIVALAAAGSFTVASGLAAAGLTAAAAALVGLILLRTTLFHPPLPGAVGRNVAHGRWLLGAEVGFFLCTSAYPFLLAATRGPESVAVLSAANLILNPLNVIWFAVGTAVPIQLSRSRQRHGDHAARGDLVRLYGASIPVVGGYCLVAAVFGGPILGLVFGDAYAAFGWVVAAAAVIRLFSFHSHLLSVGLRVQGQTRAIFVGYAAAVPFSLIVGIILTIVFGIAGAMVATFGSHVIWTTIWLRAYRSEQGPDPALEEGRTIPDVTALIAGELRSQARRPGRLPTSRGSELPPYEASGRTFRQPPPEIDPIDALVEAYLAYARALVPARTDAVHSEPDLAWGVTSVDLAVVNRVMRPRMGPTADRIEAIIELFDHAGVSSSWWLDERSTPSGLTEALLRAGYASPSEATAAMMLDLRSLPIMKPTSQVELVYVTDRREMAEAQALSMRGFGTRPRKARILASHLASLADPDTGIRTVVARHMDQPVATATAVVIGSTVGLYGIATLPAARGMGFGRAVTVEVLRDARSRGVRHAVLESTPMARPLYESLGFRNAGTFLVLQRPAGGPSLLSSVRRRLRRA